MEKELLRILALFLAMEPKNTGNHIEKEGTIYFFNHIIILNLNDKIMPKEPASKSVDTIYHFNAMEQKTNKQTNKPWEPHRERGYHLKIFFFFFFLFSFHFSFFFFVTK